MTSHTGTDVGLTTSNSITKGHSFTSTFALQIGFKLINELGIGKLESHTTFTYSAASSWNLGVTESTSFSYKCTHDVETGDSIGSNFNIWQLTGSYDFTPKGGVTKTVNISTK